MTQKRVSEHEQRWRTSISGLVLRGPLAERSRVAAGPCLPLRCFVRSSRHGGLPLLRAQSAAKASVSAVNEP
jgi:hypothetical protein